MFFFIFIFIFVTSFNYFLYVKAFLLPILGKLYLLFCFCFTFVLFFASYFLFLYLHSIFCRHWKVSFIFFIFIFIFITSFNSFLYVRTLLLPFWVSFVYFFCLCFHFHFVLCFLFSFLYLGPLIDLISSLLLFLLIIFKMFLEVSIVYFYLSFCFKKQIIILY